MDGLLASHGEEFQFRVPPDPRVPYARHVETAQLWRDDLRRQAQARQAERSERTQALQRAKAAFEKLISAEARHKLDLIRREVRERHARTPQALMGEPIPQAEINRIKDALRDQGVDIGTARTAIRDLHQALQRPDPRYPLVTALDWELIHEHFHHRPDPGPRNPWVTFRPPYWGWQTGHDTGAVVDFNVSHQHLIDANTGQVGAIINIECPDASDISVGSRETHTQVAFWYQAPVTGLVEMNVTAVCGEARHWLRVTDEWGVSDCSVTQHCSIMAHALHPAVRGPSFQQATFFNYKGDTSAYRDEQHVKPGQTVFAPLVSDAPVAAGDWMMIRAGVRCVNGSITNDMEIYSKITMSWFLSRIDVHIRE